MKILQRYIIKEFLFYLIGSLFLFTFLYFLGDFLSKVWRYHAPILVSLKYFIYLLPQTAHRMFTVSCLAAPLLTLASMTRSNEIMAMSSAGISSRHIAVMLLAVTFVASLLFFLVGDQLIPLTSRRAEEIFHVEISQRTVPASQRDFWHRQGNFIFKVGEYQPKQEKLINVKVYHVDESFRLFRFDIASECRLVNEQCLMEKGESILFPRDRENSLASRITFDQLSVPFDVKLIKAMPGVNIETTSMRDLLGAIRNARAAGLGDTRFQVALHGKIAYIFACVIMTWLGIPFGLRSSGKKSGVAREGCFGLIAVLAFWFSVTLGLSFGYSGSLPPLLAAWIPNFIFAGIGALFFRSLAKA